MAIKDYLAFSKASALLKARHQDIRWWGGGYPSAEMQSMYSTELPANWVVITGERIIGCIFSPKSISPL